MEGHFYSVLARPLYLPIGNFRNTFIVEAEVCDVVMYGKIYRAQENELVSVHENDITVLDSVENKTLRRYSCILSSDRCVFLWLSEASGEKQEGLIQNRWTVFFVNDKGAIEKKQNLPYNIKKKYAHYKDAIHTPQALARGVLLLVESSTSEKIYAYISPDNDEIVYVPFSRAIKETRQIDRNLMDILHNISI